MRNVVSGWQSLLRAAFLFAVVTAVPTAAAFAQSSTLLPGPSQSEFSRQAPPADSQAPAPGMPAAALPMAMAPVDENYHLGSGDKIKVGVYGEDDLSGEVIVDGSGQVQLPLIGQVRAAGLSVHDFVAEVEAALSNGYLKDPKVSVEVENYRPFYIMGEVNKPGEYPYENGLTVLGAVALAGGYTYRASQSHVYIRRNGSTEEDSVPADATSKINPGDYVLVKERIF